MNLQKRGIENTIHTERPPIQKGDFIWASHIEERRLQSTSDAFLNEGEQKTRLWQESILIEEEMFEERIQKLGLSTKEFKLLTVSPDFELKDKVDFEKWIGYLEIVLSDKFAHLTLPTHEGHDHVEGHLLHTRVIPFQSFFDPFLKTALGELRAKLSTEEHYKRNISKRIGLAAESSLLQGLQQKLLDTAVRTLTLELNVARLEEKLIGESGNDRFKFFSTTYLANPKNLYTLLKEYPVLARSLSVISQNWVNVAHEFIERLLADWEKLQIEFFHGNTLDSLVEAKIGLGDTHEDGRSVVQLRFMSGLQLIYKPRSLAMDVRFQELLTWINNNGCPIDYFPIRILDRESYGWLEFINVQGCTSKTELERFYIRQGGLLALLYILHASDFHMENLIAHGEYPVLVDLEALLHHDAPLFREDDQSMASVIALESLSNSVLRVGLLPRPMLSKDGLRSVDVSGLGGEGDQILPFDRPVIQSLNSDNMHITNKEISLEAAKNLPDMEKKTASAIDFVDSIVHGFTESYEFLKNNKDYISSWVLTLANLPGRQVIRATRQYLAILQESSHPDYLRNGVDQDQLFDILWTQAYAMSPGLMDVVPSEIQDIKNGDVPFFKTYPAKRHLWDSRGNCIKDFFAVDSLTQVQNNIKSLSQDSLEEQIELIRRSLITTRKNENLRRKAKILDLEKEPAIKATSDLVAAAEKIGEYLQQQAVMGEDDATWIGVNLQEGPDLMQYLLAPIGPSLYQGGAGIALFFAYLASETNRDDFYALARAAHKAATLQIAGPATPFEPVGAYTGRTSLLYTSHQLALLWESNELLEEVIQGLDVLEPIITMERSADILTGAAGAAIVLLNIYKNTGNPKALMLADFCGQKIIETASDAGPGIGWILPIANDPLAGFSHGVAGIVWALLELAAITGNELYKDYALRGLDYERTLFNPEIENWVDRRLFALDADMKSTQSMTAWCHGAPGILLGRLLGIKYLDDQNVQDEIAVAVKTTISGNAFSNSYCQCHGVMGNAEILHFAGEVLLQEDWKEIAVRHSLHVAKEVLNGKWVCGLPQNVETPGLMLGVAGIGMSLLHIANPTKIPSIIRLQLIDH